MAAESAGTRPRPGVAATRVAPPIADACASCALCAHALRCAHACGTERVRISLALRALLHARARAPCSRAGPGPTAPARPRRTTSLFCDGGGWPAFSGGPAALERARASLLSLSFNALDHSPDDLTVLIGELFLQVRPAHSIGLTSIPSRFDQYLTNR